MKFLAVFAAILALTAGAPTPSEWTLGEITAALASPSTNPTMIPYLEHALNQIMDALHAGFQIESVAIPLPAEVIIPTPAAEEEAIIAPAPPAAPIAPAPVVVTDSPAAPTSALVQIIVNVNNKDQATVVPAPVPSPAAVPEIVPTPVAVVDSINPTPAAVPEIVPTPVAVVDTINPTPVVVVDEAIVPTPVAVAEEPAAEIPVNPVDVIEVLPAPAPAPVDVNPIDVIAVGAPEVNPVDIMNPIPVNPAAVGDIWV